MAIPGKWQTWHVQVALLLYLLATNQSEWECFGIAPIWPDWNTRGWDEQFFVGLVYAAVMDDYPDAISKRRSGYSSIIQTIQRIGVDVSTDNFPRCFTRERNDAIVKKVQSHSAFEDRSQDEIERILDKLQRVLLIHIRSLGHEGRDFFMVVASIYARSGAASYDITQRLALNKLDLAALKTPNHIQEAIRLIALACSTPGKARQELHDELTKTPSSMFFRCTVLDALLGPGMDWTKPQKLSKTTHLLGTNSERVDIKSFLDSYIVSYFADAYDSANMIRSLYLPSSFLHSHRGHSLPKPPYCGRLPRSGHLRLGRRHRPRSSPYIQTIGRS
jgi:hypothetical protein